LAPKENDPDISNLLPTMFKPYEGTLQLNNINTAIANGFRRVILSELPIKAMKFKSSSFSTTDPFILVDFVQGRFRNIPIDQNISTDTIFSLDVTNKTERLLEVKTKDLKIIKGTNRLPFNSTFTLFMLNPSKSVSISEIYIKIDYGYNHGGHSVTCNARSLPTDIEPFNTFTKTGIPSSIADPKNFKIIFISNGNMDAKDIIKLACKELINRLRDLKNIEIEYQNDIAIITKKESDTIGNIITKSVCELYPDIPSVTYYHNYIDNNLTVKLKTNLDASEVINKAIDYNISIIEKIKQGIIMRS